MSILPARHSLFLYKLYGSFCGRIKWNHHYAPLFRVTICTRQGSILSPKLNELEACDLGVRIERHNFNAFVYADDLSTFSNSAVDLQSMVNICENYADKWRFLFGVAKSKVMFTQPDIFKKAP